MFSTKGVKEEKHFRLIFLCGLRDVLRHTFSNGWLSDATFASFVELGRRGTGHFVTTKRVELKRSAEATGFHKACFKGPITFGAKRNALVLHATDLDQPFLSDNAKLLEMLNPQIERALEERRAQSSISDHTRICANAPQTTRLVDGA